MFYTQNITGAHAALGTSLAEAEALLAGAQARIQTFAEQIRADDLPAFNSALALPQTSVRALAGWPEKFEHIVLLGMGGSSLGGKLINHFADATGLQPPHLHFIDYVDPTALQALAARLPLAKTGLIAISKSGGTAETLAQLLVLSQAWEEAGLPLSNHVLAVTEPKASPLYNYASDHDIPVLPHHPQLGGRFSIAGETGTLPALLKGVDVAALHQGMQTVVDDFLANPATCAPAQGAALQALAAKNGRNITVLYSYGEALRFLPAWLEQLWAESLGKDGHGTTPLGAVGPCSQHSIQQLFLAGPQDKLFTVIEPQTANQGTVVPNQKYVAGLADVALGTLQQAMGTGTVHALQDRRQPVRTITLPQTNAATLGALLMHFMLETVLTACIWQVNPFDQPAVEESKTRTLAALDKLHRSA